MKVLSLIFLVSLCWCTEQCVQCNGGVREAPSSSYSLTLAWVCTGENALLELPRNRIPSSSNVASSLEVTQQDFYWVTFSGKSDCECEYIERKGLVFCEKRNQQRTGNTLFDHCSLCSRTRVFRVNPCSQWSFAPSCHTPTHHCLWEWKRNWKMSKISFFIVSSNVWNSPTNKGLNGLGERKVINGLEVSKSETQWLNK